MTPPWTPTTLPAPSSWRCDGTIRAVHCLLDRRRQLKRFESRIFQVPHREIGGEVTPWADIKALRSICDAHNLHFHCDGARLWEALPHYERTDEVPASELCAAFDSVGLFKPSFNA